MASCSPIFRPASAGDAVSISAQWAEDQVFAVTKLLLRNVWWKHFLPGRPYFTTSTLAIFIVNMLTWTGRLEGKWVAWVFVCLLLLPYVVTLVGQQIFVFLSIVRSLYPLTTLYRDQEGSMFLVAECCGRVVGFVVGQQIDSETSELVYLFVHASHRQRGIGQTLTAKVEEFYRARSHTHVVLYTLDVFAPARRLYERMNYQEAESFSYLPRLWPIEVFWVVTYRLRLLKTD